MTGFQTGNARHARSTLNVETVHIDSASIHDAVSGVSRRGNPDWTDWETRAICEVTLPLMFASRVHIPPPLRRGPIGIPGPADPVLEILSDCISEPSFSRARQKFAREVTERWADESLNEIRRKFELAKEDPSLDIFVRWHVENEWVYHIGRLGSLIDRQFERQVRTVLRWTPSQSRELLTEASSLRVVKLYTERYKTSGSLPPDDLINGYLVSTLIRGRYYQEISALSRGEFIWSPFRDYALRPVGALTRVDKFANDLTRLVLAGMICRGAMEERSAEEAIAGWAENIRRFRNHRVDIAPEDDQSKAIKEAVDIARRCELRFRWTKLETVLEGTVEHLLSPLVAFAAGLYVLATFGSHPVSLAAHVGSEWIAKPFLEALEAKICFALTHSQYRLEQIGTQAAKRLFAVRRKDLPSLSGPPT